MKRTSTKRRPGTKRPKLIRLRPIDGHVGGRVKLRRHMLGLSQQELARAIGITFQQLQKNERGLNRIGASRLYDLSKVLDVPLQFFFDEMPAAVDATARDHDSRHVAEMAEGREGDVLAKRETLELVRAYYRIKSPRVRKNVVGLAKTLAMA